MLRHKSGMGYITCVAAAAVVGAVGYSMMCNSRHSMRAIKRKATKTVGRISDRVIDNIDALM